MLVVAPGAGADAAGLLRRGARARGRPPAPAVRAHPGAGVVRRRRADVPRRRGVGGHVRDAGGRVRGGAALRPLSPGAAGRARRPAGARGRAAQPPAGLHRRDPRRHRHLDPRGRRAVRARRPPAAGRRAAAPARARRRAGAAGRRGRAAVLRGRHRRRDRRLAGRSGAAWSPRRTSAPTRWSTASRCAPAIRGREVLTNPPPSAGGILIARALAMLDGVPGPAVGRPARRRDGDAPRTSARPSSWPASGTRSSCGSSWPGRWGGWARRRTSPRWIARAGRVRSRAPTARHPASSCPAQFQQFRQELANNLARADRARSPRAAVLGTLMSAFRCHRRCSCRTCAGGPARSVPSPSRRRR